MAKHKDGEIRLEWVDEWASDSSDIAMLRVKADAHVALDPVKVPGLPTAYLDPQLALHERANAWRSRRVVIFGYPVGQAQEGLSLDAAVNGQTPTDSILETDNVRRERLLLEKVGSHGMSGSPIWDIALHHVVAVQGTYLRQNRKICGSEIARFVEDVGREFVEDVGSKVAGADTVESLFVRLERDSRGDLVLSKDQKLVRLPHRPPWMLRLASVTLLLATFAVLSKSMVPIPPGPSEISAQWDTLGVRPEVVVSGSYRSPFLVGVWMRLKSQLGRVDTLVLSLNGSPTSRSPLRSAQFRVPLPLQPGKQCLDIAIEPDLTYVSMPCRNVFRR